MNNREDILSQYLTFILSALPTIYILVNITLLIWLAQTIFTSNLQAIPRSIYLISPFFAARPLIDIQSTFNESCQLGWEQLKLKTFPTIFSERVTHKYLYEWGKEGRRFCVRRMASTAVKQSECAEDMIRCNGYCMQSVEECPITGIFHLPNPPEKENPSREYFWNSSVDGWFSYGKD